MERHTEFRGWKAQHSKTSVLPRLIYGFNAKPGKILAQVFVDRGKLILKFI